MNQDSFRQLLATSHPGSSSSSTQSRVVGQSTKKSALDSSQPAFQPRKIKKKKSESDYRDRASERRAGVNDYAQVESVLEVFEQRTAAIEDREAVEEQRRYLGGDKDHTILVKGLDFALLEQNRARATASHEDDDTLEAAFQAAQPKATVPKKRTREDIIRELKEKRASDSGGAPTERPPEDDPFEKAKKVGKFKPIGAPGTSKNDEKIKRAKGKELEKIGEVERKRKRRKVRQEPLSVDDKYKPPGPETCVTPKYEPQGISTSLPQKALMIMRNTPDPQGGKLPGCRQFMDEDQFDIFADAGEYEGVDFGDDEDEPRSDKGGSITAEEHLTAELSTSDKLAAVKSWFKDGEHGATSDSPLARYLTPPAKPIPEEYEESDSEQVTRLAPLASSALPSISDFLAMDAQAEAQKKRKAKKEKKKGGEKKEKLSTAVKVDRDYKKLNSYIAKKGSTSKAE